MDCFHSSKAQVVVEIKEGNGFTFLTNPVIIVASLNGIKLETKEILPSNNLQFDSELVWQADPKYLRRLRVSNTALKLECFTFVNYHKQYSRRDRIGYILLNLKEAQIITHGETVAVSPSWHRLLGLKNSFQAHKPELLLKFKIEEVSEMKSNCVEENTDGKTNINTNFSMGDGNDARMFINQMQDPLQIGPPHLCTELYELSINIISVGNLSNIMPQEKVEVPIKAHFAIFGYSFFTKDLSVFRENMNNGRISLKIWSQLHFICAYFKEFPTLILTIYSEEDVVGTALMDLKVLGNLTTKRNITINDTIQIVSKKPEGNDKLGVEVDFPFLEMEVQLLHKKDCISTKIDQETQSNCEFTVERYDSGDPPCVSSYSLRHIESNTVYHNNNVKEIGSIETTSINPIDVKLIPENSFASRLNVERNESPEFHAISPVTPVFRDIPSSPDIKEHSKKVIKGAAIKACEELEDWKEKQQEMFKFELKKKTDRHLKKLSNEWLKKKYELEDDLKKRIEECQVLKEKLISALEDLTKRSEQLTIKEEELKMAKEELDKKYTTKFQELRKASKLHEYDMEDKIHEMNAEKTELYKKLEDSRKEILRLQDALLNQDAPQLSKEQTATLINEIRNLEQKLEKAVESKTFFKEQWGKAVRELHRMKEEEQQHLKWQIQKNRQELQTLGLVQEISQEVGEMKKDQSTIKNIRNELANFISANNDPLVDHFQNTY